MPFGLSAITRRLRDLGPDMSPSVIQASAALYAPFHEQEPYRDVRCTRDVFYGPHERHRLDVFEPVDGGQEGGLPVLVFVHGGGFVGGDKRQPGTPYQDNVALWAVRHGLVGVNITHRLAPEFAWPAGAEDVAAALQWVREHVAQHRGDPDRIHLMGTSAGAVHAASYVSHPEFHRGGDPGIAGAILLSGAYDFSTSEPNERLRLYLGEDRSRYAERSSIDGLVESNVPLLYVLAELDPPNFEQQALEVISRHFARHGRWPRFIRLMGHNHFTATLHLNTPDEYLGRQVLDFAGITAAAPVAGGR